MRDICKYLFLYVFPVFVFAQQHLEPGTGRPNRFLERYHGKVKEVLKIGHPHDVLVRVQAC